MSYLLSFLLSQDFIKELVDLFHNTVSIFQSVQKKERKSLSKISIQKGFGMPQKRQTLLSMSWLIFRRIPENAPDLELARLTLGHSVLSNSMSMLSPMCTVW